MKKAIFILSLFLSAGFAVFAQTLNLEQARILALANSRSLARYELSIRSSILDERNQLYAMLPSVSAEYRASMNYLRDWEFLNPVDTFSTSANFSITQIIFQGGKSFIQRAIGSIATESVRKDALAEYFNVIDSVDNAYFAVLEAKASVEAEEASLEAAALSLSIAEIRNLSGMINMGDYLKALADKEARENSYNQARRNLSLCEAKLRVLTGITGNTELEQINFDRYEDVLLRLSGISDEEANTLYEEFWKLLCASNPSLAKAALNSQRADRNLTLAKRDFAPTLSASVFSSGLSYSTASGFNTTSSGGVTISGSIPVDFWVIANRIEKSSLARDSAALDYISAESSLEMELQSALLNALAQAGSVLSSSRSLDYTERHFEFVMERYRLSVSSVSDLSEATSLFITSRNNYARARYGFLQSLSKLRALCALDDEERLINLLLGE
ncbi:MAG: TolC family protein [Treponema sp.]|jgi:outer membrane protein TolC|nr:TolC family protein [Treponema sp.]